MSRGGTRTLRWNSFGFVPTLGVVDTVSVLGSVQRLLKDALPSELLDDFTLRAFVGSDNSDATTATLPPEVLSSYSQKDSQATPRMVRRHHGVLQISCR